ncbi:MAG TPA: T9SS type A sorting domain-containing protein [Bacteroidales bacterium]|jgi:hypothetical protein|nr:T9SS type A sorting domain-containing protein [Bacteroidales bacterium]HNZ42734.1 T9SS type A sorting domain-containing protein [Bacteroidales bacterium]HPB25049.1 T9SS type A sorting domain-containing protein [Bacteroidales bacterium]HPI29670.1 T9SS type A sorting domain-containing protein [Bacteroidales bacterium]HQN15367.1 T9SS type A sorting domain-containing protein [Bacteroidales bacterium]
MRKIKFEPRKSLDVSIHLWVEIFCTIFLFAILSFRIPAQNSGCCNFAVGYQVSGYAQISPETFAQPTQVMLTAGGTQSVIVNTPLTPTTYAVTGATSVTVSGLPPGVSFTWISNVVTIAGTPTVSGLFDYLLTAYGLCETATETGTIMVITGLEYDISGKTSYLNKAIAGNPAPNVPTYDPLKYNIDNVIVILKTFPAGTELARDTGNALGIFEFTDIPDGNYMLSFDKYTADTMQLCNGINAIDVAMVKYLIGHDTLIDPSLSYSAKHKIAADVDNNDIINAIDVGRIKAKIGLPGNVAGNFPKGNWPAMDTLITIAGANVTLTLKTVGYGDYDASATGYKDSLTDWASAKQNAAENIIVKSDKTLLMNTSQAIFEIPLWISENVNDFSALGLELSYPNDRYKLVSAVMPKTGKNEGAVKINPAIEEIISSNNDLLVTDVDGIIRVVYATTEFFDLAAHDEVLVLGFCPLTELQPGYLNFELYGTGVIGNQYGQEMNHAFLFMPAVWVQSDNMGAQLEFMAYPNPFGQELTLKFSIPEKGSVVLSVYNMMGERVACPVSKSYDAGKHTVVFSPDNLPKGLYSFKMDFSGMEKSESKVLKLIH